MKMLILLAAGAAVAIAAPAAAQYPYPSQPYPQAYPQTYPGYPGYQQPYGGQGAIGQIIDSLLGNRYNVTDRRAVSQCAAAATAQAQHQYRVQPYGQGYGYQQGYGGYPQGIAAPAMRVTAITSVERRSNGLRVRGLLSSGYGGYGAYGGGYGAQYGYQNQGYAAGDLGFRCNVDYRGVVTNVRITRNAGYRQY